MSEQNQERVCPCGTGKTYAHCCQPLHQGQWPKTALELMRSRYAAYALGLPDYIICTTHPGSPQFHPDLVLWSQKISEFCAHTEFQRLEILDFQEKDRVATVTFVAHLKQNQQDLSFTERSYFEKIKDKWMYRSGQLAEGHAPNLMTSGQLRLLPLAYYGHAVLRKVADPIEAITDDLRTLVAEMMETMDACDGIGIAAPQVHHSIKLFLIRQPVESENGKVEFQEVKVFINPEISLPSSETWKSSEACLSIPSLHADVERPKEVLVEYTDLQGTRVKKRVSGWEARVILHENDHLNGVLFIDHLAPEERQRLEPFLKSLENRIHNGTEM
jgi:peptide deformylase